MDNKSGKVYGTIQAGAFSLKWEVWGKGDRTILAFHGYGQDPAIFATLAQTLPNHRVFAFYLPFHCAEPFQYYTGHAARAAFRQAISEFVQKQKIQAAWVVGFSIGARLAFYTFIQCNEYCQKLTLLAPDGLYENPWFRFFTHNKLGRAFFMHVTEHSAQAEALLRWLPRIPGLKRYQKAIKRQYGTTEQRKQLRAVWFFLQHFKADYPRLGQLMEQKERHISVWLGEYDKLIGASRASRVLAQKCPGATVQRKKAGHFQLLKMWLQSPQ